MKRFKKNSYQDYIKYGALVLLLMLTLGYALISTNLNITGTSNFSRTTWNIHFENLVPSTNMTLGTGEGASITQNKTTEVTYTLTFSEPGDYYEFLVDAKNDGTLDGMVSTVTSTKKLGNETAVPITTNPSNLPAYLEYSATYSDGTPIAQYHLLASGEAETYKVRIAFRTDIEASDLPGSDQSIELTFGVEYVQKDSNAVPSHPDPGIYTVNVYDGTDSSIVSLGQAIPNSITTYQTPALAMAALKQTADDYDLPFYLRHITTNNIVTESSVGFVISPEVAANNAGMTAGTYYLRNEMVYEYINDDWQCKSQYDDGEGNCISQYYDDNVDTLKKAFGVSNCIDYSTHYYCIAGDIGAGADPDGSISVGKGLWQCGVNYFGEAACSSN